MSKYDTTLFQYFQNIKQQIRLSPLNLGGVVGAGGGAGGPPGGFIGYLPQTRVSYDTTEATISGFISPSAYNASGYLINASLVDNLNHIRYRLQIVEGLAFGGGTLTIQETGITIASGISSLNFVGAAITNPSPGHITITMSGGGSGVDEKVKVSSNDTTTNYLEQKITAGTNVTITVLNEGTNEQIRISASGIGGGGAAYFTDLLDVPSSYSGQAGKVVVVNGMATGLEFSSVAGGASSVLARYVLSSGGQTFSNGSEVVVQFQDKQYDTHNAVTTGSSWKFTAPRDGYYLVNARMTFNGRSWGTDKYAEFYLYKNSSATGSWFADLDIRYGTGTTIGLAPNGHSVIYLASGEYIHPMMYQNSGGDAVAWTGTAPFHYGYITITSIGGTWGYSYSGD